MKNNIKKLQYTLLAFLLLLNSASTIFTVVSSHELDHIVPRDRNEKRINADNIKWKHSSKDNLLGGADEFSAILFDSLKNFHEAGAAVATRLIDNVNIITFTEGLKGGPNQFSNYEIPYYNIGMMTNHIVNKTNGENVMVSNGDVVFGIEDFSNQISHGKNPYPDHQKDAGSGFLRQGEVDTF